MPDKMPPRVKSAETWWVTPPPAPSPRLAAWVRRIDAGWRPNKRVARLGYSPAAAFFGVYTWEYLHVLSPLLWGGRVGFTARSPREAVRDREAGEAFLRAIRGESEVVA